MAFTCIRAHVAGVCGGQEDRFSYKLALQPLTESWRHASAIAA